MTNKTVFLNDALYQYVLEHTLREPDVLRQLREETSTHTMAEMQICPEQGQFMQMLVKLMNAKKIIELGVFTGYSSLSMALALPPEGQITACDINEEWTGIAKRYWEKAEVAHKIDLRLAPALDTLDAIIADGQAETYDLAFIDADKQNSPLYYEKCLTLLRSGGLLILDNAFKEGAVIDLDNQRNQVNGIRETNEIIKNDERVDPFLLPLADGLFLARKH